MKVGDYVRFYNMSWTEIGQITGEVEDSHLKVVKCGDGYYELDNFIKSSPNIIDLIEVGDYVNGVIVTQQYMDNIKHIAPEIKENNYGIKSIVTHEQFLQMEYKVGD